jgi:hypothetical protein
MSYLGNTPTTQSFISGTDYFNGTGAQTAFTLSRTVASVNDIEAVVNNVVQQPNDAYTISGTTITFTSAPSAGTNNVYVRYLSTTTQAITPSQGTVGWNQLNSDTQQDLGISFKNRIINGNMRIDQRNAGASVTPAAATVTYTLDRWAAYGTQASKFSVQQNAGSVTPPAGFTNYLGVTSLSAYSVGSSEGFWVRQVVEGFNIADLGWGTANAKTVTLSFWVRSSLTGTFGGTLLDNFTPYAYPFSYSISAANTWEQKSITIVGPTSGTFPTNNTAGTYVQFGLGIGSSFSGTGGSWQSANLQSVTGATSVVGTNGATWYITGVMLEVGTQATTFTTAGGSYGAELALCQRYYEKSYAQATAVPTNAVSSYVVFGLGTTTYYGGATGDVSQNLNTAFFKVTKRANPTVTTYSYTSSTTGVASNGWTGADLAAATATVAGSDTLGFNIYNGSGANRTVNPGSVIVHFAATAEL